MILPNVLINNHDKKIISCDSVFAFAYVNNKTQDKMLIRNTTHVMVFLTQGRKKLSTKDEEIFLKEGMILCLRQGNYFMREVLSERGVYQAFLVYFDDLFITNFLKKYAITLDDVTSKEIVSFRADTVLESLVKAYSLYIEQDLEQKNEILKLKTEEILLYLLSTQKYKCKGFLHAIQSTAKDRIKFILENNLDIIENVEDMCNLLRITKHELRDYFKNRLHTSPKIWLDKKRLEKASFLLKESNEPISSIATTCGYSSLSWFGSQFKKVYGLSPKVYREQNR